MPKAKPTQVIVHRIELQETERAAVEAALAGKFVTNGVTAAGSVLSGIGGLLAPFGGVLTAVFALWAADKTWDMAKEAGEEQKQELQEQAAEAGAPMYNAFTSYLNTMYAVNGRAGICDVPEWRQGRFGAVGTSPSIESQYVPELQMRCPNFFIAIMHRFFEYYCAQLPVDAVQHQQTAVELFEEFYPLSQYGIDAYYYAQQALTQTGGVLGTFLGWIGWAK